MSDWEDRLDDWEVELELAARLAGSEWVTLDRASRQAGVSRAALRTWYRNGLIPSRLVAGPHGPQRLVPLAAVTERAAVSPRLRRAAERTATVQAAVQELRERVDRLETRLAAVEQAAAQAAGRGAARPD